MCKFSILSLKIHFRIKLCACLFSLDEGTLFYFDSKQLLQVSCIWWCLFAVFINNNTVQVCYVKITFLNIISMLYNFFNTLQNKKNTLFKDSQKIKISHSPHEGQNSNDSVKIFWNSREKKMIYFIKWCTALYIFEEEINLVWYICFCLKSTSFPCFHLMKGILELIVQTVIRGRSCPSF